MNVHDERWPEERFRQLRQQADPDIDKVVAEYLQAQPAGTGALELVKAVVAELGAAKREAREPSGEPPASEIFEALQFAGELPEWGTTGSCWPGDRPCSPTTGCTSRPRCSSRACRWRTWRCPAPRCWPASPTWPRTASPAGWRRPGRCWWT
ncbi:hypothetical protein ACFQ0B_33885 [Nonomuraea thailandensis]